MLEEGEITSLPIQNFYVLQFFNLNVGPQMIIRKCYMYIKIYTLDYTFVLKLQNYP